MCNDGVLWTVNKPRLLCLAYLATQTTEQRTSKINDFLTFEQTFDLEGWLGTVRVSFWETVCFTVLLTKFACLCCHALRQNSNRKQQSQPGSVSAAQLFPHHASPSLVSRKYRTTTKVTKRADTRFPSGSYCNWD